MSVPSWERELSKTQYLYELLMFNIRIGQIVANKPKKYKGSYGDRLINTCLDAFKHAQAANEIFMCNTTLESDYLIRREHLQKALAYVDNVSSVADVFLSLVAREDGIRIDKLEKEELYIGSTSHLIHKLIKGVLDSDKAIFAGKKIVNI